MIQSEHLQGFLVHVLDARCFPPKTMNEDHRMMSSLFEMCFVSETDFYPVSVSSWFFFAAVSWLFHSWSSVKLQYFEMMSVAKVSI